MASSENQTLQCEEVEALKAIYCQDGEMTDELVDAGLRVKLDIQLDIKHHHSKAVNSPQKGEIALTLPSSYPQSSPPTVDLNCDILSKESLKEVEIKLGNLAKEMLGEMVLLDVICLAKELLEDHVNSLTSDYEGEQSSGNGVFELSDKVMHDSDKDCKDLTYQGQVTCHPQSFNASDMSEFQNQPCQQLQNSSPSKTAILRLDHMRSKGSYSKLIQKWAEQLNLGGRLIFCQKIILIVLQGTEKDIKEYIVRNRTTNVDVDSKGRSCKERMLSVVCETTSRLDQRLPTFSAVEVPSLEDLSSLFQDLSLCDVYNEQVKPQLEKSSHQSPKKR